MQKPSNGTVLTSKNRCTCLEAVRTALQIYENYLFGIVIQMMSKAGHTICYLLCAPHIPKNILYNEGADADMFISNPILDAKW
jgi:hypothetical protein